MKDISCIENVAWKMVDQKYVNSIDYCRKEHAVS